MKNILLVDDDVQFRTALKSLMGPLGHNILEAGDGLQALEVIKAQDIHLVISDIRMPKCDGVELLKQIKNNYVKIPVILITGFAEIIETTNASELGADGFLPKPFKFDEIRSLVEDLLNEKKSPESPEDLDDQYCKIPLEDFVTGSRIKFNIYHRLTGKKYLKIAYSGEDIEPARIETYKAKGMRNLYLTKSDFSKYVGFNMILAKKLETATTITPAKKREFLRYTSELILEQLFVKGSNQVDFEVAAEFIQTTINLIKDQEEAFSLLEALNRHADFLYAHSLGVSIYSVMVARELKWHWGPTLFKISLAGLMHDIGFKEIPRKVLEAPRVNLTLQERNLYESHTTRGMEILNGIRTASDDVVLIAYQHHEDCMGKGYPQQLQRQKTHPLARLISLVDAFCEYTIRSPGNPPLSAGEAMTQLKKREGSFDLEYFSALNRVFKNSNAVETTS